MNIFRPKRKNIEISICLALCCAIMLSLAHFDAACEDLRKNVLRLHIIANSDSAADQSVKLKVRDEILDSSVELFKNCETLSSAISCTQENLAKIETIANSTLKKNGFSYTAKARIGNSYFETREYDEFTLPAGSYKSLIIDLGEGKGKNWWCVIFPKVCVESSGEELSKSTQKESAKIAENPKKYKVKFKCIEWYEDLKRKLKK